MTDVLAGKVASPKAVLAGVTADHTEGMSYLQTLPRRLVTLYLPLSLILFVLLFPFYWMALTAIKPGIASGSTILIKICQRLAPSIRAHSSSSNGMVLK